MTVALQARVAEAASHDVSAAKRPLVVAAAGAPAVARGASPGAQVTLDEFEVLDGDGGRSLGKGSFGVVRRIRKKGTSDVYALKTMQKLEVIEGDLIDQVEREIQVQRTLKHENVLRLYKHFEDAETVYLLLEYCAKGELYQLLRTRRGRRFPEPTAQHYFTQVVHGLQYLHSQSIVHRDLKPENLLVNHDNVLKIADFGWCASISGVLRMTFCGTLDYLAPEMVQGHGHNHTLDIWSVGVLLYEMVVGRPPFQSTDHTQLIAKILSPEINFPAFVSHECRDLVHRLLQKDPNERLPLELVVRHVWVTSNLESKQVAQPTAAAKAVGSHDVSSVAVGAGAGRREGSGGVTGSNGMSGGGTGGASTGSVIGLPPREMSPASVEAAPGANASNASTAARLIKRSSQAASPRIQPGAAESVQSTRTPSLTSAQSGGQATSQSWGLSNGGRGKSGGPTNLNRTGASPPQTPVQQAPYRGLHSSLSPAPHPAPGRGGAGASPSGQQQLQQQQQQPPFHGCGGNSATGRPGSAGGSSSAANGPTPCRAGPGSATSNGTTGSGLSPAGGLTPAEFMRRRLSAQQLESPSRASPARKPRISAPSQGGAALQQQSSPPSALRRSEPTNSPGPAPVQAPNTLVGSSAFGSVGSLTAPRAAQAWPPQSQQQQQSQQVAPLRIGDRSLSPVAGVGGVQPSSLRPGGGGHATAFGAIGVAGRGPNSHRGPLQANTLAGARR